MNRSELIDSIAQQHDLSRREAETAVNTMFHSISDAITRSERVEVRGFGSFTTRDYEPYMGRNPKTGASVEVPAKRLPFFKAGKNLQERLND
jgi:integration host factor subunit beta